LNVERVRDADLQQRWGKQGGREGVKVGLQNRQTLGKPVLMNGREDTTNFLIQKNPLIEVLALKLGEEKHIVLSIQEKRSLGVLVHEVVFFEKSD